MIHIRKAQPGNLSDLLALDEKIYADNYLYDADLVDHFILTPEGKAMLSSAITAKDGMFYILYEDDVMIGFASGKKRHTPYWNKRCFELDHFGVLKEKQHKGYGTLLLNKVFSWVKAHGYEKVYLNCFSQNTKAITYYKHRGFSEIEVCLEKKL